MRLVVARCEVTYTGRLTAYLPEAIRLLIFKADGSVLVHADAGGYRPLNWMTPPTVIEDDQQRAVMGFASPPRLRTIVTRRWRMTIAHGDAWGELYDLDHDPHEMENLFEDAPHRAVRAELMERLAYRQMELADRSPLPMGRA